jgi:hypothetical protein
MPTAHLHPPAAQYHTLVAGTDREVARLRQWNAVLEGKVHRKGTRLQEAQEESTRLKGALAHLTSSKLRLADLDLLYFELQTKRCVGCFRRPTPTPGTPLLSVLVSRCRSMLVVPRGLRMLPCCRVGRGNAGISRPGLGVYPHSTKHSLQHTLTSRWVQTRGLSRCGTVSRAQGIIELTYAVLPFWSLVVWSSARQHALRRGPSESEPEAGHSTSSHPPPSS